MRNPAIYYQHKLGELVNVNISIESIFTKLKQITKLPNVCSYFSGNRVTGRFIPLFVSVFCRVARPLLDFIGGGRRRLGEDHGGVGSRHRCLRQASGELPVPCCQRPAHRTGARGCPGCLRDRYLTNTNVKHSGAGYAYRPYRVATAATAPLNAASPETTRCE